MTVSVFHAWIIPGSLNSLRQLNAATVPLLKTELTSAGNCVFSFNNY
jgi:hypothetical protein